MFNLWMILEISLAASITGGLLLAVKALFHDKLSARWHYLIWGVFLARLLVPVEQQVFRTPIALLGAIRLPAFWHLFQSWLKRNLLFDSLGKCLFWIYGAGVLALLLYYGCVFLWLRIRIRKGEAAGEELWQQVRQIADRYQVRCCSRIRICTWTSTPFVTGIFFPVLVLPKKEDVGEEQMEDMILHELLHMQYGDVAVNLLIHLIRICNWFNPLLWYVLARIQNDNEALCDQRVLERLERNRHKEYGLLLLHMAEQSPPPAVGTTSMANGSKNIRRRLKRIVDFGHVPKGNTLVSLCITLILTLACVGYAPAKDSFEPGNLMSEREWNHMFFRAGLYEVSTPQEALYIYMKAIQTKNPGYMALLVPEEKKEAYENWALDAWRKDEVQGGSLVSLESGDGTFFPQISDTSYIMGINGFWKEKEGYQASIHLREESYQDAPKEYELALSIEKEYGWKAELIHVEDIKAEENGRQLSRNYHSAREEVQQGKEFQTIMRWQNRLDFISLFPGGGWFLNEEQGEGFEKDFSEKTKWVNLQMEYTGKEDLTGKVLSVSYGPQEILQEEDGQIAPSYAPGSTSSCSDGTGGGAMRIPKDWDGIYEEASGYSDKSIWDADNIVPYMVRIYVDGQLADEFCFGGGSI